MPRPEAGRAWGADRGPRVSRGQASGAMPRHAQRALSGSAERQESPGSGGSCGPPGCTESRPVPTGRRGAPARSPRQAQRRVRAGVQAELGQAAHPLGRPLQRPIPQAENQRVVFANSQSRQNSMVISICFVKHCW